VTNPKSGDVIVFLPNGNEKSHYYVKRVVAVPGDTVLIEGGILYVNGEKYEEEIDVDRMDDAGVASEEITLGADEYFVLGDNRNNSEDSRFANIGNIRKDYIIGKAWFIISPFRSIGFI
jgi:signal peptidase I